MHFTSLLHSIQQQIDAVEQDYGKGKAIICFDFFDTLVRRSVYPEATKKIAAARLVNGLGLVPEFDAGMIYRLRGVLERKICEANVAQGLDAEFCLEEVSTKLYRMLGEADMLPAGLELEGFIELNEELELITEHSVQLRDNEVLKVAEALKQKGYRLVIVSDFYLRRELFLKMAGYHGFDDLFDDIFVSCEVGKSKRDSGKLYRHVAESLDAECGRLVMIGDNPHADVVMAQAAGCRCVGLERAEQHARYAAMQQKETDSAGKELAARSAESAFGRIIDKFRQNHFAEMGVSLWLFTHRLYAKLVQDGVKTVFFCSKEGEFLRKLFIQYQQQCFGFQPIKAHYLLVSRKATYICSLRGLDEEDFLGLFYGYRDLTLCEFLQSLNFSHKQSLELCRKAGVDGDVRHQNLREHPDFHALLAMPYFQDVYEKYRNTQREGFHSYLKMFGEDMRRDGLAMVDVGWKGSIQNNIHRSFAGEVQVRGYYLGLLSPTEVGPTNLKTGILFYDGPRLSPFIHCYNNNRSLFEMLLGASHGSADGYFSSVEYEELRDERGSSPWSVTELIDGGACTAHAEQSKNNAIAVTVLDLPQERTLYNEQIRPLQDAMLDLNKQLNAALWECRGTTPSLRWFALQHARMVFSPRGGEIDFFCRLYHLENFGLFEFTDFLSAGSLSLSQRWRNFKALRKNPEAVLETGVWPPVILRRLGLGFLQKVDGRKRYRKVFHEFS